MANKETMFVQDLKRVANSKTINWKKLTGKHFLITGATGIIGYSLVCLLLETNKLFDLGIQIIALTRNLTKAKEVFAGYENDYEKVLFFIEKDATLPLDIGKVDYIIHGAAITSSKDFISKPVETIMTSLEGTKNVLEYARDKRVDRMIYLSTMEIYGYPPKGHKVSESEVGAFVPMDVRNCYPMGKLTGEMMCVSFYKEYGVPVNVLRLSQTFGPNVRADDNRLFAYFLKCVQKHEDIVLRSKGETERSYLYSLDAATAIMTLLVCDEVGEIFNVADEDTYCSVFDFAQIICKKYGIGLRIEEDNDKSRGFANTLFMDLDTTKIQNLGWKPLKLTIEDIYDRMI